MSILSICLALIEDKAEQDKFEALYYQYRGLMYYCAQKLLHDEHLAEDAVSIAFLQVAQNMDKVDEVMSASTKRLMVTIVERKAMTLYQRQQREYNRTVDMDEVICEATSLGTEENALMDAILQLPLIYQQVILLKYSRGYSSKEIAAILDYTVAKVDQLLSRGRRRLKKLLEAV